jgi:hypothetical protein
MPNQDDGVCLGCTGVSARLLALRGGDRARARGRRVPGPAPVHLAQSHHRSGGVLVWRVGISAGPAPSQLDSSAATTEGLDPLTSGSGSSEGFIVAAVRRSAGIGFARKEEGDDPRHSPRAHFSLLAVPCGA